MSAQNIPSLPGNTSSPAVRAGAERPPIGVLPSGPRARELTLAADLAPAYLAWQCRMIAGVMRGAVFLPKTDGTLGPMCARWPQCGQSPRVLADLASRALPRGRGEICTQVRYSDTLGQVCDALSVPVLHDGRPIAVIVVTLSTRSDPQQKAVQQLIEWGANWFETLLARESKARLRRAPVLLDLLNLTLEEQEPDAAAKKAVTLLAERAGCERVSLGVARHGKLRLTAVSGIDRFDRRTQFASRLEDAMEEAADQNTSLEFPAVSEKSTHILRAHKRLSAANPSAAFFTTTAGDKNSGRVALVVEYASKTPPTETQKALFNDAARTLVSPLALLHQANRPLAGLLSGRRRDSTIKRGRRLMLWSGAAALLLIATAITPATYRLTADASLAGVEQRAIVAPIAGYVKSTSVRPGDDVLAGDVLAVLDTRDLELERDKLESSHAAREAEYHDALARHDRTEVSILRARLQQIAAELALVESQMTRSQLRSPYAGVVISGDLSQALAAPVEQGQVLFEVAPLSDYRVVLEIDEHDIAAVKIGLEGYLRLAAMPNQTIPFVVERVLPVAVSGDGYSFFRVEARLREQPPQLRPGMRGVAKITAGQRSVLWLWGHALLDRLRLVAWSLGLL